MPNLNKINCPHFLEGELNRMGYSSFDAKTRLPVQNSNQELADKIRARQPKNRQGRLLNARHTLQNQLQRTLSCLLIFVLIGEEALAEQTPLLFGASRPSIIDFQNWMTVIEANWSLLGATVLILISGILAVVFFGKRHRPKKKFEEEVIQSFDELLQCASGMQSDFIHPESLDDISTVVDQGTWHCSIDSRTGKVRSENQDAVACIQIDNDTALMVVCDGAGGRLGGKLAASFSCEIITKTVLDLFCSGKPIYEVLEASIEAARLAMVADHQQGITTAIVCFMQGVQLHYACLGDGGLTLIYPDGMVSQLLVPHHVFGKPSNILAGYIGEGPHGSVPSRIGMVRIEPKTLLLAMSDGVSEIINYQWLATNRKELLAKLSGEEINLAKEILDKLEEARHPKTERLLHHDNMTLALGGWS